MKFLNLVFKSMLSPILDSMYHLYFHDDHYIVSDVGWRLLENSTREELNEIIELQK